MTKVVQKTFFTWISPLTYTMLYVSPQSLTVKKKVYRTLGMTWACKALIVNPLSRGPSLGWARHFGWPSTWCALYAQRPQILKISLLECKGLFVPLYGGEKVLWEMDSDSPRATWRREQRQGRRDPGLSASMTLSCLHLGLRNFSRWAQILKDDSGIIIVCFKRTDVLGT